LLLHTLHNRVANAGAVNKRFAVANGFNNLGGGLLPIFSKAVKVTHVTILIKPNNNGVIAARRFTNISCSVPVNSIWRPPSGR
jgi:hypothetical protein